VGQYVNQSAVSYTCKPFWRTSRNKKLSWCWQTHATRLEDSQGHQTAPLYVMYSFLLCNSNFFKNFLRHSTSKMSWPWYPCQRSFKSLKVVPFDRSAYDFRLVFYRNFIHKTGLRVRQGHWKCHYAIEHIRLPIDIL